MKHSKTFLGFMVLLCAAALFLGCPTESNDDDGGYVPPDPLEFELLDAAAGIKYYSLTTGEVTESGDIASNKWDIAFEAKGSFLMIYTNSGDSSTDLSGGNGSGGVRYTAKTNFDAVTLADAVDSSSSDWDPDLADYQVDKAAYLTVMGVPTEYRLNVMTFAGYATGDGSYASPFTASGMTYPFDKKAFFSWPNAMPPVWGPTNQVYIITHGDGVGHSKLQVSAVQYVTSYKFNFTVKYENL
jgi:hypothetical protein